MLNTLICIYNLTMTNIINLTPLNCLNNEMSNLIALLMRIKTL